MVKRKRNWFHFDFVLWRDYFVAWFDMLSFQYRRIRIINHYRLFHEVLFKPHLDIENFLTHKLTQKPIGCAVIRTNHVKLLEQVLHFNPKSLSHNVVQLNSNEFPTKFSFADLFNLHKLCEIIRHRIRSTGRKCAFVCTLCINEKFTFLSMVSCNEWKTVCCTTLIHEQSSRVKS